MPPARTKDHVAVVPDSGDQVTVQVYMCITCNGSTYHGVRLAPVAAVSNRSGHFTFNLTHDGSVRDGVQRTLNVSEEGVQ